MELFILFCTCGYNSAAMFGSSYSGSSYYNASYSASSYSSKVTESQLHKYVKSQHVPPPYRDNQIAKKKSIFERLKDHF